MLMFKNKFLSAGRLNLEVIGHRVFVSSGMVVPPVPDFIDFQPVVTEVKIFGDFISFEACKAFDSYVDEVYHTLKIIKIE